MSALATGPIRVTGDLTVQTAAAQKALLLAALEADGGIELDLSEVAEADTAGLQLLLLLKQEAGKLGKDFQLLTASEPVLEVLTLAQLDLRLEPILSGGSPPETHTNQNRGSR